MKFWQNAKYRALFVIFTILAVAVVAYAHNINTSGQCPFGEGCVLGDASHTPSVELATNSTGDAAVVLPTGSIATGEILDATIVAADIAENGVKADNYAAMSDKIIICGEPANDGTIYFGPEVASYLGGGAEFAIGGGVCNALDNATEATADAPIEAGFPSFKVTGMYCQSSSDAAADEVITLRSAEANLTPSVTCTIAGTGSATSCATVVSTTTDIAAGATIAIQDVSNEDLSGAATWCEVYFAIKAL